MLRVLLLVTIAVALSTALFLGRRGDASAQATGQCQAASIRCPIQGGCPAVSSPFGVRTDPVTGRQNANHTGVDYPVAAGTTIVAAAGGKVEYSQLNNGGYGQAIILRHTDGSATLYAHLQTRNVQVGATVAAGDVLGISDTTGKATGPHLHFEYVPNGTLFGSKSRIDPAACVGTTVNGSIRVADNGNLADDAFRVSVDGFVIGETQIGAANNLAVNGLQSGSHQLTVTVTVAPDNVGTLQIDLSNGWHFSDGTTSKSATPALGESVTYTFIVP